LRRYAPKLDLGLKVRRGIEVSVVSVALLGCLVGMVLACLVSVVPKVNRARQEIQDQVEMWGELGTEERREILEKHLSTSGRDQL
jgi:hypothetical protein